MLNFLYMNLVALKTKQKSRLHFCGIKKGRVFKTCLLHAGKVIFCSVLEMDSESCLEKMIKYYSKERLVFSVFTLEDCK